MLNQIVEGTDVKVQDLINALCDVLDGENVDDFERMGFDENGALKLNSIRNAVKHLWTHEDGSKVLR